MDIRDLDVDKMSTLEMLGIRDIVRAYNYYSSKDKDEISEDIRSALREAGIGEDDPRYARLFGKCQKEAFEMRDKVSSMSREEFFSDGYLRLKEEFGFGEREEIREPRLPEGGQRTEPDAPHVEESFPAVQEFQRILQLGILSF